MENIKASLAMYFAMIDKRVDDEDEMDPRLLYGTSWRFQAPEEVESWSLAMIISIHARYPVLLQVQKERNILEANDGGAC